MRHDLKLSEGVTILQYDHLELVKVFGRDKYIAVFTDCDDAFDVWAVIDVSDKLPELRSWLGDYSSLLSLYGDLNVYVAHAHVYENGILRYQPSLSLSSDQFPKEDSFLKNYALSNSEIDELLNIGI